MSGLPEGWASARLDSVGAWGSGGTPSKLIAANYEDGTIPWLVIGDLNDGVVRSATTYITPTGLTNSSAKLLSPNTLLIAMYGSIGKLGITGIECATNQAIAFCRPHREMNLSYLFRALQHARPDLMAQGQGGTQLNISQTILKAHEVPLAPLPEQKRIADKLDSLLARVDGCRDRLDRIPALLKRFRQSVLAAATSGRLTEDWREHNNTTEWEDTTPLGSLGSVSGGLTKNAKRVEFGLKGPYLRVANVHANELRLDDVASIGMTEAELNKTRLEKGDLLIVEGNGSLEHIGRVAIWNGKITNCSHQNHLIRWRSSSRLVPKFALYFLLSPEGRNQIIKVASSTTGLYTLSISKVSGIAVPVPDLTEQHEIVRRVEALFAFIDRIEARYATARKRVGQLTPALLAKAFRGELVAQDPADEPASELLARLAATRAAAPKAKRGRKTVS